MQIFRSSADPMALIRVITVYCSAKCTQTNYMIRPDAIQRTGAKMTNNRSKFESDI